jgi:Ca2+-binding RTX toxin-like protein
LGGSGNDVLHGNTGADVMVVDSGNDTYFVDVYGDRVVEFAGQGTDSVSSTTSYDLPAHVENLTLLDVLGAPIGGGNELANVITGNSTENLLGGRDGNDTLFGLGGKDTLDGDNGNDRLIGGDGADWLWGGLGDDRFEFGGASSSPKGGGDRIADFNTGNDTIVIDLASGKGAYIGTKAFTPGGNIEARYDSVGDQVQVDLNNNGVFGSGDLQILGIATTPTTSDFVFV